MLLARYSQSNEGKKFETGVKEQKLSGLTGGPSTPLYHDGCMSFACTSNA